MRLAANRAIDRLQPKPVPGLEDILALEAPF